MGVGRQGTGISASVRDIWSDMGKSAASVEETFDPCLEPCSD